MSRTLVFLILVASTTVALGQQSVVTRCAKPSGHVYYPAQPLVPKDKAGWHADGISNGDFLLLRKSQQTYDIVFTDATNRTVSSVDDGGSVIFVAAGKGHLVLLVNYPDTSLETWFFRLDSAGHGELTISQAKYGEDVLIKKHGLMRAQCSR